MKKKKKKSFIIVTALYNTNSISFIVHANSEFNDVCGDLSLSKARDLTAGGSMAVEIWTTSSFAMKTE